MMARLRAWLDAWRHPGEYPRQRTRRRYLEGIRLAELDRQRIEHYRLSVDEEALTDGNR
jgi:hypothetical protein